MLCCRQGWQDRRKVALDTCGLLLEISTMNLLAYIAARLGQSLAARTIERLSGTGSRAFTSRPFYEQSGHREQEAMATCNFECSSSSVVCVPHLLHNETINLVTVKTINCDYLIRLWEHGRVQRCSKRCQVCRCRLTAPEAFLASKYGGRVTAAIWPTWALR